jgi:basic membrane lipoprotein Med (substrate-binding protein (PBP1-ABC) superfamily)
MARTAWTDAARDRGGQLPVRPVAATTDAWADDTAAHRAAAEPAAVLVATGADVVHPSAGVAADLMVDAAAAAERSHRALPSRQGVPAQGD